MNNATRHPSLCTHARTGARLSRTLGRRAHSAHVAQRAEGDRNRTGARRRRLTGAGARRLAQAHRAAGGAGARIHAATAARAYRLRLKRGFYGHAQRTDSAALPRAGDRHSLLRRHAAADLTAAPAARTAVVMPLYHEPVERSLAGLRAVYLSLQRTGHLDQFDFYILSDSRDPEVWLAEQASWHRLCQQLDGFGRVHYRRRVTHLRHKSGNIADFLRRWGGSYRYFMVLDADSLMSGAALLRMVNLMEREPQVGILQTSPAIVNARSAFARLQQCASRAYGAIFATGLA